MLIAIGQNIASPIPHSSMPATKSITLPLDYPYITNAESLEQREGKSSFTVDMLNMPDHTATHVDAPRHFGIEWDDQGIDSLPLERFYTEGICLHLSHLAPKALYGVDEVEKAFERWAGD